MYTIAQQNDLQQRWDKILHALQASGADALLLSTSVNLLYVLDRVFNGYFYLTATGEVLFFVKRPLGLGGEQTVYIRKPEDIPAQLQARGWKLPQRLAVEGDAIPHNDALRLQNIFNQPELVNASQMMRAVRSVKTAAEIAIFRETARKHALTMQQVPGLYRPGMRDVDFAIAIEHLFRSNGSLGLFRTFGTNMEIFMGSLLTGDNALAASPYDFALGGGGMSTALPIGCSGELLSEGKAVMVDYGGSFSAYLSDLTRTYAIGKLPEIAYRAHQCALEIQEAVEQTAQEGTPCKDLYDMACTMAQKNKLSDYFMGYGQQAAFVGHGIGLEINELPILFGRSKEVLVAGNVFALEPKFVLPGIGAVGIENSYVVHPNRIEKLTLVEEQILSLT